MVMIMKDAKIVLFAALFATIIIPLAGMSFVEADSAGLTQKDIDARFMQVTDVYDDDKLNHVKKLISNVGSTEFSKTKDNGDRISENVTVIQHSDDSYKIIHASNAVTLGGVKHPFAVTYLVTQNEDGSLYINVPAARPSPDSNINNSNGLEFVLKPESESPIPVADATSGTKKFTMEVNRHINNNFVDGNDRFSKNCGMYGTTASMYGAADATKIGNYWRSINANTGGAYWYYDWCIIPYTYEGVEFEMGGSGYSDDKWKTVWGYPGWGPTGGLQFPWDNLHFRTNAYYG